MPEQCVSKNYQLAQGHERRRFCPVSFPLARTAVTLKQIYADAADQKAVVWEMGARAQEAASEVEQLFREILPDARRTRVPREIHCRPGICGGGRLTINAKGTTMAERRPLTDGLKTKPEPPREVEEQFVFGDGPKKTNTSAGVSHRQDSPHT